MSPAERLLRWRALALLAAAVVCCLAVGGRGLGEFFLLVSVDESVQQKKARSAGFRHEYPTVTLDDVPRMSLPGRRSAVVQQPQLESQDGSWRQDWIFGPPLDVSERATLTSDVSSPRAAEQQMPAISSADAEPAIVYMPGAAGTPAGEGDTMQPVGYIFLPDVPAHPSSAGMRARPGSKAQQLAVPGTVPNPEYERKFLPFLSCWVWGGDQVLCTKNGKTTVTIIMDDGTTMPGGQATGTFEIPVVGGWLKHPSPNGDCYSTCDFYWASAVLGLIPVVLICLCCCICLCGIWGCWASLFGGSRKKDEKEDKPMKNKADAKGKTKH